MINKYLKAIWTPLFGLLFSLNLYAQLNSDSLSIYYTNNQFQKVVDHANQNIIDYSQLIDTLNINYYFKSIYNIANQHFNSEQYSKAASFYNQCIKNFNSLYGKNKNDEYADYINELAICYLNLKQYSEAEPLFIEALEIRKLSSEEKPLNLAISINNLAQLYSFQGKYLKAEPFFAEALVLFESTFGKNNDRYDYARNQLAIIYNKNHKYAKAETLYLENVDYARKKFGEEHLDYGIALDNLGLLYYQEGKFSDAEPILLMANEVIKLSSGKESMDYAISLNNLGKLYFQKGDYLESEQLFLQTLNIKKSVHGDNSSDYAITLRELAKLYKKTNRPQKQEIALLKSLEIYKKTLGEYHPRYSGILYDLAFFYTQYGVYEKANDFYSKACTVSINSYGENNTNYLNCINMHARLLLLQSRYESAEKLFLEALSISEKIIKKDHVSSLSLLHNLAVLYQYQGRFLESQKIFKQILETKSNNYGEESSTYAITLGSYAETLDGLGEIIESEKMLLKSVKIIEKTYGKNNEYYNQAVLNLADIYILDNKIEDAVKFTKESVLYFRKEIVNASSFLTSNELLSLKTMFYSNRVLPLYFLENFKNENDEIVTEAFQNELLIKNLSLRNIDKTRKNIEKSDNQYLKDRYKEFIINKKSLLKIEQLPIKNRTIDFEALKNENELLEKEIIALSETYSDNYNALTVKWEKIKSKLQKDEVLIDFINFNDGPRDLLSAFVLKKDFKYPKYISVLEQNKIDSIFKKYDVFELKKVIDVRYVNTGFKNYLLYDISKYLEGVNSIYISPSGMMHKINFSALPISEHQTLGDKYKVHILGSSADILKNKPLILNKENKFELLLYGDIDYDKSELLDRKIPNDSTNFDDIDELFAMRAGSGIVKWSYLSGTYKEVNGIKLNSEFSGFKASIISGKKATKSSILELNDRINPYVLHLATHGFFFENPKDEFLENKGLINDIENEEISKSYFYKASDDPMLRSGLVFAGANKYWGESIDASVIDDGILTAREISNLDLSACQLVVLSACDTGLGDINGSEGVYGLQRAFKMAGVKNIIMSLWKVPDVQTAELFELFYEACFKGNSVHESLRLAQSIMKEKYEPYYWAGFVLLE